MPPRPSLPSANRPSPLDDRHPSTHRRNAARSDESLRGSAPIYPAYCNPASPTFNKWVKLTATDLHALRLESSYEKDNIYHHLNHPIRFVYLCGVIVAVEFPHARFAILTLDDASGATVEVKVERVVEEKRRQEMAEGGGKTLVDGLMVQGACEEKKCALEHLVLDGHFLRTGDVIKAKGTIEIFRGTFQVVLKRASLVRTTAEEIIVWNSYAEFVESTLARPWLLSDEQVKEMREKSRKESRAAEKARMEREQSERRRRQRRKEWEMKKKAWEDRQQVKMQREARELDGNALDRPGWKPFQPTTTSKDDSDSSVAVKDLARQGPQALVRESISGWFHDLNSQQEDQLDVPVTDVSGWFHEIKEEFDKSKRRKS